MSALQRILTVCTTGLLALVLLTPLALAVGVKPLRTELTIDPGSQGTATLTIINSEDRQLTVRPEIQVYTRNDKSGYPVETDLSADDPRNIASWITFGAETLELGPNSTKEVIFTVTVPENAEPGGRYAALTYSPIIDESSGGVQIQTRVASLILITVTGEQRFGGQLTEFGIAEGKMYSDQPVQLAVGFENQGNVHVKAAGSIVLTDTAGNTVPKLARYTDPETGREIVADTIPVNLNRGNILPDSTRVFGSDWNENIQLGTYTATLTLYYADGQPPLTQSTEIAIAEELTLDALEFSVSTDEEGAEHSQFELTATNSGGVYERLDGKLEVTNEFGDLVRTIEIPTDIDYIAPNTTQALTFDFLDTKVKAGEYTVALTATYGFGATPITIQTTFTSVDESGLWAFFQSPTGWATAGSVIIVLILLAFFFGRCKKEPPLPPEPPVAAPPFNTPPTPPEI